MNPRRTKFDKDQLRAIHASYGNPRRGSRSFRSSKRTGQQIRKRTETNINVKSQKSVNDGRVTVQSFGVTETKFPKQKTHTREDLTSYNDPTIGIVTIQQREEASRYTPKTTTTVGDVQPDGTIQVTKIGGRKPREVSQLKVSVTPPPERFTKKLDLEAQYKKWDELPPGKEKSSSVLRLSVAELRIIADDRNVSSAGITQSTLEQRLRKSFNKGESTKKPEKTPFQKDADKGLLAKLGKEDPEPPNKNIKTTTQAGRNPTESEGKYFEKVRTAPIIRLNRFGEFKKELQEWTTQRKAKDPAPAFKRVREKFDKKYSRFEQDKFLLELERQQIIDLQIASDQRLISDFGTALLSPNRGAIYFVNWRR